jgi:hypothetical protein
MSAPRVIASPLRDGWIYYVSTGDDGYRSVCYDEQEAAGDLAVAYGLSAPEARAEIAAARAEAEAVLR